MNRSRLSTYQSTVIDMVQLNCEINRLLSEPSNIEIKEGKKYIKNLNKYLPASSRSYEKFHLAVQVIDAETGCVLYNFESTRSCAAFLGLVSSTTSRYLKSGKRFLFNNRLVYIQKVEDTEGED